MTGPQHLERAGYPVGLLHLLPGTRACSLDTHLAELYLSVAVWQADGPGLRQQLHTPPPPPLYPPPPPLPFPLTNSSTHAQSAYHGFRCQSTRAQGRPSRLVVYQPAATGLEITSCNHLADTEYSKQACLGIALAWDFCVPSPGRVCVPARRQKGLLNTCCHW